MHDLLVQLLQLYELPRLVRVGLLDLVPCLAEGLRQLAELVLELYQLLYRRAVGFDHPLQLRQLCLHGLAVLVHPLRLDAERVYLNERVLDEAEQLYLVVYRVDLVLRRDRHLQLVDRLLQSRKLLEQIVLLQRLRQHRLDPRQVTLVRIHPPEHQPAVGRREPVQLKRHLVRLGAIETLHNGALRDLLLLDSSHVNFGKPESDRVHMLLVCQQLLLQLPLRVYQLHVVLRFHVRVGPERLLLQKRNVLLFAFQKLLILAFRRFLQL